MSLIVADNAVLTAEEIQNFLTPVDIPGQKRMFRCDICLKMTSDSGNMRRHMVLKHAKPEPNNCPRCLKVFYNRYYLRDHIRICGSEAAPVTSASSSSVSGTSRQSSSDYAQKLHNILNT